MNNSLTFPLHPYKTKGGIHTPHNKNTSGFESVAIPAPKSVTLPMSQHIGAPCIPCVKTGDHVKVGQKIADSTAFVSAPIHASISGKIKKIDKITMPDGSLHDAITIESDGEMSPYEKLTPPATETKDDFLKAVRESGLVGLGGAGFPAHVKLNIPSDKNVDTLIINVAECEPYITCDHREVIENSWDIMSGVYAVKEFLNIKRIIIGIENNKPDAIKILRGIADNSADSDNIVKVLPLKASYPQGAEKILIKACTNREIPIGGLPSDAGCIVMNVGSISFLSRYLKTGMPLVSKRITVDGSAINEPKNLIVPIGTSIKDIIDFCGGYKDTPGKILMGGPMMGTALPNDDMFILKQNNAILAFDQKDAILRDPGPCIRCGKCADACPMNLIPMEISNAVDRRDTEHMTKLYISNCMECGCCSFSCPAKRHLVQNIRLGKALLANLKKQAMKKGSAVSGK